MKIFTSILYLLFLLAPAAPGATYYVDYAAGLDANTGTTKANPWKRCPAMKGFGGAYVHKAGDRFIFKGGVVWPAAAMSLYITQDGTAANPDYYGVDQTWYTGGSWSRPVFDCGGQAITDTRPSNLSSIFLHGADYVTVDNIEIRNQAITGTYFATGAGIGLLNANNCMIKNCYIHDWVVKISQDGKWGGISNWGGGTSIFLRVDSCTIRGPATVDAQYCTGPGRTSGAGVHGWMYVANCDISKTTQGTFSCAQVGNSIIHDGGDSYRADAHENGAWVANGEWFHNNVMYNWAQGTAIYMIPGWASNGGSPRCFNNIVWGTGPVPVSISEQGNASAPTTKALIYNNILVSSNVCVTMSARTNPPLDEINIRNNLFITSSGAPVTIKDKVGSLIIENNATMTPAVAAANGLNTGNLYAPQSVISALHDKGQNISTLFTYDKNNKPRTGTWDIGAYEWSGAPGVPPPPPPVEPSPPPVEPPPVVPPPVAPPGPPGPIPWMTGVFAEAEDGAIFSPFVIADGHVSQAIQTATDPATGGRIGFRFVIVTAGDYRIKMAVNAPDTASDSFFVNVDGEPQTPGMVWDIQVITTGTEEREVTWRGSGTVTAPEFAPKTFNLSAGEHTLIVRGREAGAKIDKITIYK